MIVVNRFRVQDEPDFVTLLEVLRKAFADKPGCATAESGRNVDDPSLWLLITRWADVGSYRRALSSYETKVAFGPVQRLLIDEPSAFEPATGELNQNIPR